MSILADTAAANTSAAPPATAVTVGRRRGPHIALALGLAFAGILALSVPFALTGIAIPDWLPLIGRWIPAVAGAIALTVIPLGGRLRDWWGLRAGGWRGLLRAYAWAVVVMGLVIAVPVALTSVVMNVPLAGPQLLGPAAIMLLVGPIALVASTLGEEVFWRGQLQRLLEARGFWTSSLLIGGIWMLWHLPLHGVYALQGSMPLPLLIAGTVSLLAWAPLLTALVARGGSVWPAAIAHAVPLSAPQLLQLGADQTAVLATVVGLNLVAMLLAAALLRPARRSV